MPSVCVLLATGFEELEAVTIIDVLRRASIDVTTVAVASDRTVVGGHTIPVVADVSLQGAVAASWDAVILPGGAPAARTLRDDPAVQGLLTAQSRAGRLLAAICAGPIALGKAGVLAGQRATCYPGFEAELTGAELSDAAVVDAGNIITSRGPGTAMAFALRLVTALVDGETAATLRRGMLVG